MVSPLALIVPPIFNVPPIVASLDTVNVFETDRFCPHEVFPDNVLVPLTVRLDSKVTFDATRNAPPIPTPPEITAAPVLEDVVDVVL